MATAETGSFIGLIGAMLSIMGIVGVDGCCCCCCAVALLAGAAPAATAARSARGEGTEVPPWLSCFGGDAAAGGKGIGGAFGGGAAIIVAPPGCWLKGVATGICWKPGCCGCAQKTWYPGYPIGNWFTCW